MQVKAFIEVQNNWQRNVGEIMHAISESSIQHANSKPCIVDQTPRGGRREGTVRASRRAKALFYIPAGAGCCRSACKVRVVPMNCREQESFLPSL